MRKSVDFSKFTNEELWEIYKSVNIFQWNDLLGEKPEGFDKLRNFRFSWWHFLIRRTRDDYTHPIWCLVQELMPQDFFEKKKEEHHKKMMEGFYQRSKEVALSDEALKKRFGKLLYEHMSKQ